MKKLIAVFVATAFCAAMGCANSNPASDGGKFQKTDAGVVAALLYNQGQPIPCALDGDCALYLQQDNCVEVKCQADPANPGPDHVCMAWFANNCCSFQMGVLYPCGEVCGGNLDCDDGDDCTADECNFHFGSQTQGICTHAAPLWYRDADGDGIGVGDKADKIQACQQPQGYMNNWGDCDDADKTVYPGAVESCNGMDDNCDGQTDEEGATGCVTFYYDGDGDQFGVENNTLCLCSANVPYAAYVGGDCDDMDKTVYPGALEVCNLVDDNCDALVDEEGATGCSTWYFDGDDDGFGVANDTKCLCGPSGSYKATRAEDCDDTDPHINPDIPEVCDGKDNDCDGQIDEENAIGCKTYWLDADQDTWGLSSAFKCLCVPVGLYTATQPGDCNDADPVIFPGAVETCDGKDNDCDALVDEELGTSECGVGACWRTVSNCAGGLPQQCVPGEPSPEACNMVDDDCDALVDEELGSTTCGLGECEVTVQNCMNGLPQQCVQEQASAEVCDFKDNNCDGQTDEGLGSTTCGVGECKVTVQNCAGGVPQTCMPGKPAAEVCGDLKDNDCNGKTDEEDALNCFLFYYDGDADGFGIADASKCLCSADDGQYTTTVPGDCDDDDAAVYPGATEDCNGKDDDCNGETDEVAQCASCYWPQLTQLACGETYTLSLGDPGQEPWLERSWIDTHNCNSPDTVWTGYEAVASFSFPVEVNLTVKKTGQSPVSNPDNPLDKGAVGFFLNKGQCSEECLAWGNKGVAAAVQGGQTYWLVLDQWMNYWVQSVTFTVICQ